MPNWCRNTARFTHNDSEVMDRLFESAQSGHFFMDNVPLNDEREWDYEEAYKCWGTKWDIDPEDVYRVGNTVTLVFDTAWAPPIAFYEAMLEKGFEIEADYYEPGMNFIGRFENGTDFCFEVDSPPESEDYLNIFHDLIDVFEVEEN
jgi:hypothetical protein